MDVDNDVIDDVHELIAVVMRVNCVVSIATCAMYAAFGPAYVLMAAVIHVSTDGRSVGATNSGASAACAVVMLACIVPMVVVTVDNDVNCVLAAAIFKAACAAMSANCEQLSPGTASACTT